jgi:hypothetical protein
MYFCFWNNKSGIKDPLYLNCRTIEEKLVQKIQWYDWELFWNIYENNKRSVCINNCKTRKFQFNSKEFLLPLIWAIVLLPMEYFPLFRVDLVARYERVCAFYTKNLETESIKSWVTLERCNNRRKVSKGQLIQLSFLWTWSVASFISLYKKSLLKVLFL